MRWVKVTGVGDDETPGQLWVNLDRIVMIEEDAHQLKLPANVARGTRLYAKITEPGGHDESLLVAETVQDLLFK